MVVLSILYLLLVAVLAGSGTSIDALAKSGSGSDALTGGLIAVMFLAIIAMFLVFIWAASTWYKAANKQVDTGMLEIKDFLSFKNVAGLMAVNVLSWLVISLGFILLIIPGLFAAFFFTWMPAVKAVRPELSVGETFGASIEGEEECRSDHLGSRPECRPVRSVELYPSRHVCVPSTEHPHFGPLRPSHARLARLENPAAAR